MSMPAQLNVSRETMERLEIYAELLRKWNPRINLVSKSTLDDLWQRHILDSAQLFHTISHPTAHWADLGSGGGFPGLVIAIMATETGSPAKVTLVESDTRKCAFLRSVLRETGTKATVLNDRIENIPPLSANILSARALADLSSLLSFAQRHLAPDGTALLPKGKNWHNELLLAQSKWHFQYELVKSETETGPVILSIRGVTSV